MSVNDKMSLSNKKVGTKSFIKVVILLIIFIVADIFLAVYTFEYQKIFWTCHFLLSVIFTFFISRESYGDDDISINLIAFFPIVGLARYLGFQIFTKIYYTRHPEPKEGLESTLIIETEIEKLEERLQYFVPKNSLFNYNDLVAIDSIPRKSEFLMTTVDTMNVKKATEAFNEGLKDDDVDIVHYAGVKLNRMKARYLENIDKNRSNKTKYITACYAYCSSGIPKSEILEFYQDIVYRECESLEKRPLSINIIYFKMCFEKKEYKKCEKIADDIMTDEKSKIGRIILEELQEAFYEMGNMRYCIGIEKVLEGYPKKEI